MRLTAVIPSYNEARTIVQVIDRVRAVTLPGLSLEILVVDDGSTDGTRELLVSLQRRQQIRLIAFDKNCGKGAALRAGFQAATGDVVLVQDADLEYDPSDYGALLSPILDGRADVVFGTRFADGRARRVNLFWHMLVNRSLTLLSNATTGLNLSDMEVGYKVFRREVLQSLRIESNRFGVEPELAAKVALGSWRVYEVPISYCGRSYAEGKKIGLRDGLEAVREIIRFGALGRLNLALGRWRGVAARSDRLGARMGPAIRGSNGSPRAARSDAA